MYGNREHNLLELEDQIAKYINLNDLVNNILRYCHIANEVYWQYFFKSGLNLSLLYVVLTMLL